MTNAYEWTLAAPPDVASWLDSIHVQNFLREQRNFNFQMIGAHDGSMSDQCKLLFQSHYKTVDAVLKALTEIRVPPLDTPAEPKQ